MFTLTMRYLIISCHLGKKIITILAKANLTKSRTVFPLFECFKHISNLGKDLLNAKLYSPVTIDYSFTLLQTLVRLHSIGV